MKKTNFMLFAVTVIAAASCAKEITPENPQSGNAPEVELIPMTFTAGSEATKAQIVDGTDVHWQVGDQINVFDASGTVYEPFTTTEGGVSVTFAGMAGKAEGYYALYPYQSDAKMEDGAIYATLPSVQTAVEGSFDPKAFISVAQSDAEGNFSFKNVMALVRFTMPEGENATSATISANADNENLSGAAKITINDDGIPSQTYVSGQMSKTVTLKGNLEAGKTYYFVIRSGVAFSEGLTISIDGRKYRTSTASPSENPSRNKVMNLPSFTFKEGLPNDLYTAYEHGFDLQIGLDTYNKSVYGQATLISTTGQSAIPGTIYFVNPAITDFKVAGQTALSSHVTVIGRYADRRSSFTQGGIIKLNGEAASVAYKGLDISWNNKNQPFQIIAESQSIVVDNCYFNYLQNSFTSSSDYAVNKFSITNSEIHIKDKDKVTIYDSKSTSENQSYLFQNNIIFVTGDTKVTEFRCMNITSGAQNVTVMNNTFDATTIPNSALIKSGKITGELIITNNIFHDVTNAVYSSGSLANSGIIGLTTTTGTIPTGGEIRNNFYYKSESSDTRKLSLNTTGLDNVNPKYGPALSPVSILSTTGWNPAEGKFDLVESFTYTDSNGNEKTQSTASLGAKR